MALMMLVNSADMTSKKMGNRHFCQCDQCEGAWFARVKKPQRCPFCNTRAWDRKHEKRGPKPRKLRPKAKPRGSRKGK